MERCFRKNTGFSEVSAAALFHRFPRFNAHGSALHQCRFFSKKTSESRIVPSRRGESPRCSREIPRGFCVFAIVIFDTDTQALSRLGIATLTPAPSIQLRAGRSTWLTTGLSQGRGKKAVRAVGSVPFKCPCIVVWASISRKTMGTKGTLKFVRGQPAALAAYLPSLVNSHKPSLLGATISKRPSPLTSTTATWRPSEIPSLGVGNGVADRICRRPGSRCSSK